MCAHILDEYLVRQTHAGLVIIGQVSLKVVQKPSLRERDACMHDAVCQNAVS